MDIPQFMKRLICMCEMPQHQLRKKMPKDYQNGVNFGLKFGVYNGSRSTIS
jgi:hypothetical protein